MIEHIDLQGKDGITTRFALKTAKHAEGERLEIRAVGAGGIAVMPLLANSLHVVPVRFGSSFDTPTAEFKEPVDIYVDGKLLNRVPRIDEDRKWADTFVPIEDFSEFRRTTTAEFEIHGTFPMCTKNVVPKYFVVRLFGTVKVTPKPPPIPNVEEPEHAARGSLTIPEDPIVSAMRELKRLRQFAKDVEKIANDSDSSQGTTGGRIRELLGDSGPLGSAST